MMEQEDTEQESKGPDRPAGTTAAKHIQQHTATGCANPLLAHTGLITGYLARQYAPPTCRVRMACSSSSYPSPSIQPMVLMTMPAAATGGEDSARRSSTAAIRSTRAWGGGKGRCRGVWGGGGGGGEGSGVALAPDHARVPDLLQRIHLLQTPTMYVHPPPSLVFPAPPPPNSAITSPHTPQNEVCPRQPAWSCLCLLT